LDVNYRDNATVELDAKRVGRDAVG
jgi:hypothetical protein